MAVLEAPDFKNNFETLPAREREILKVIALCLEPISRSSLIKILTYCRIRDEAGKNFIHKTVKDPLAELFDSSLLLDVSGSQKTTYIVCPKDIAEILTEMASREDMFDTYKSAIQRALPLMDTSYWGNYGYPHSFERLIRDVRFAIYSNDLQAMKDVIAVGEKKFHQQLAETPVLALVCDAPFRPDWFAALNPDIQLLAMFEIFYNRLMRLDNLDEHAAFWKHAIATTKNAALKMAYSEFLATYHVLRGELKLATTVTAPLPPSPATYLNKALAHFLTGDFMLAVENFETVLDVYKRQTSKRYIAIMQFAGLFYPLALLKAQPEGFLKRAREFLSAAIKEQHPLQAGFLMLEIVYKLAKNDIGTARENLTIALRTPMDQFNLYFAGLATFWYFPDRLNIVQRQLQNSYTKAHQNGYLWLEREFSLMLQKADPSPDENKKLQNTAARLEKKIEFKSLTKLFAQAEPWELKLKALLGLDAADAVEAATTRLVWMLYLGGDVPKVVITPKEQKKSKSGNWSSGRNVSLKRLLTGGVPAMTDQDRRVASAIYREERFYGGPSYFLDVDEALPALIGHPLLFLEESPNTSLELVKGEPTLIVEQSGDEYVIQFSDNFSRAGTQIIKETPTRYKLLQITSAHLDIQHILDYDALRVPAEAKDRVLKAIGNLSRKLTVHSGLDGAHADIPLVDADSRIRLHLLPLGNGFRLDMLVRPFATAGPYYHPGSQTAHLITEVNGRRLQTRRNLEEEKENAAAILDKCPALAQMDTGSGEWFFESPEECLEMLSELEGVREEAVVEWPEGERLKIKTSLSLNQMSLRIKKEKNWFALSGELQADNGQVFELRKLLDIIDENPGRFVEISDGQFLALTQKLKKQLAEMRAIAEVTKSGLRFHPLLSPVVEAFADQAANLKADTNWKTAQEQLRSAENHRPKIPSTLQAELRDYQKEGYYWLSRLAKWGVGGCLADDMGLGKTVQALAAILERAKLGPALVIAPASVTTNWISEANRFAPSLKTHLFGGRGRQETIDNLGKLDLLVCSYGLLPQEIERLEKVEWSTIVLDEAQAIKNAATKRSRAAMKLNGGFKLITTGTPIENHLGELWNLFRFINPGLLGSLKKFNERFAIPIERFQDGNVKKRLKRIILPFILRRIKSEVLDELPPKTEITLNVALSKEESAFYEALRQKAVASINAVDTAASDKRFQILAEIMRLRRACCHPKLILPESTIPSSKLALFSEIVEELLENRHKALVFSQFVGHLAIIREYLEEKGISYQYLDGATPTKKRADLVNAFQSGEGDLFLISLRAGGLGLNLTAADYVIHLDPWWNPAVEDQASDRSHRIGQHRPVTIYRLVTSGTIEEKILALHHDKRDLADSLLDGSDVSGKITAAELLEIIQEA